MPVTVAKPLNQAVTNWDEYTGRLRAIESVEIRARVSGYLDSIHFRDGQIVSEGDLLFIIDPRPYQAALGEAQAQVTAAEVRLELARNDLDRAQRLFESRAISEEELDARTQEVRQARAALQAAQAAVDATALNVEFTEVRAPIDGRIGETLIDEGNLISGGTAGSTLLTTLVRTDPVHVYFTADERSYLRYLRLAREGIRPSSRDTANPVMLALADEDGYPHQGVMDFVDNQVDPATGTMEGRALFDNPEGVLTPGLFAKVMLVGQGPYDALLIPDGAIGTDQSERFVYVMGEENIPQRRPISPGRKVENLRIVLEGLDADDWVVVNGIQRIRPDTPVQPEQTTLTPPDTDIAQN